MVKKTLLNGKEKHFSTDDLPLLIHGADGHGASLFSISVVANLYTEGAKLLFLCGYHMARDEFEVQTEASTESILTEESSDLELAMAKRVIFVTRERSELFSELIEVLPDVAERVVFIKNFDLFDEAPFKKISRLSNVILAGDIDRCSYAASVSAKAWKTRVYFTPPKGALDVKIPQLPKYNGYLSSDGMEGLASLA